MKIKTIYIILIILLFSCKEERENQVENNWNNSGYQNEKIVSVKNESKRDIYYSLKSIVKSHYKEIDSLVIDDKIEISKYSFITEKLNFEEIDSIEFYGNPLIMKKPYYGLPTNTLLIIYYNNLERSRLEFDNICINWKKFMGDGDIFKAGGMAFVLKTQLCIYKINACRNGNQFISEIDSLIKKKVFDNIMFRRIIVSCGEIPPMTILEN